MTARKLDGNAAAAEIKAELVGRIARLAERGVTPGLGTLLVGANRMTPIRAGESPALLLGPLTVDPPFRDRGVGRRLMDHSLEAARAAGHRLVLLVGDEPYYARVGFRRVPPDRLQLPGPVDPARLLFLELADGALEGARGVLAALALDQHVAS